MEKKGFICKVCQRWNFNFMHSCACGVRRERDDQVPKKVHLNESNSQNKKYVLFNIK